MANWNHDPRKFLLMFLNLRNGMQFRNIDGVLETYLPDVLPATEIKPWQYRLMLSLDGEKQFVEVVKDVQEKYPGEFGPEDVWHMLDWLLENDLLVHEADEEEIEDSEFGSILPNIVEPVPTSRPWVKVPCQIAAVLLICASVAFASYITTPYIISLLVGNHESPKIAAQEVRTPQLAETEETVVAGMAPVTAQDLPDEEPAPEAEVEGEVEISIVDQLRAMREEMMACQIRRDEYKLLNDEQGYQAEVDRIEEISRELERITDEILP